MKLGPETWDFLKPKINQQHFKDMLYMNEPFKNYKIQFENLYTIFLGE